MCIPTGITEVEQRAVEAATKAAGARAAFLIEEPMAAAIGAGLPVQDPAGTMVVDIGGGTTEVAVISFGGIVTSTSVRVGGDEMDEAIIYHVKKSYSISVGERTAEAVKLAIGSAFPIVEEEVTEIKGRDLVSGLPRAIEVTGKEIREAMAEPVNAIVDATRETLDRCPPELAGDIMNRGIVLAVGGALLRGIDQRLGEETKLPIHVADEPLSCVAMGAGMCLEQFQDLKGVLVSARQERPGSA